MAEQSQWIINTTDDTFEADVLARSELGLVVVDFWADWCAPCRMLGPILEQLVVQEDGRFTLVKADTEDNQTAAAQFGVSGIPAVFAVLDRQVVDSFQGALPEPDIKQWLERLESVATLLEASRLANDDPDVAEQKIRGILAQTPDNAAASIALAELLLGQDRDDESRDIVQQLESRGFLEPEAEKLKAMLALKSKASIDVDAARFAAQSNPDDFDAQLVLAEALVGHGQHAEGFDICLSLVEHDRNATGEKARALMVEVFQSLPADSELVNDYRRRLSMLLY